MRSLINFFSVALFATTYSIVDAQGQDSTALKVIQQIHNAGTNNFSDSQKLDLLSPFLEDSATVIRERACQLAGSIAVRSDSISVRRHGIEMLVRVLASSDHALSGRALNLLKRFSSDDFSSQSKKQICMLLNPGQPHLEKLILLAGFIKVDACASNLTRISRRGAARVRWSASLALARMGSDSSLHEVLTRVRSFPVNDDVVYRLFPDLIYTRRREAIDHVIVALHDQEKKCLSADAEREEPIQCGYRIMEMLAHAIEDYPLEIDEYGDVVTDDYPTSLTQVRRWFTANGSYRIKDDNY